MTLPQGIYPSITSWIQINFEKANSITKIKARICKSSFIKRDSKARINFEKANSITENKARICKSGFIKRDAEDRVDAATKRLAGVACRNTMKSNDQYTRKNLTKQLKTKQPPDAETLINKPSDSNGRWT